MTMTSCTSIEQHPLFADVAPAAIAGLSAREAAYAPGAFIFREGDAAESLYLLGAGRVALELDIPPRGVTQLESLGAGDILGLSWLFPPYRWHLDARAVEPVRAFVLGGTALRAHMAEDPVLGNVLATRMLRYLYDRLERVRLQRLDLYRTDT